VNLRSRGEQPHGMASQPAPGEPPWIRLMMSTESQHGLFPWTASPPIGSFLGGIPHAAVCRLAGAGSLLRRYTGAFFEFASLHSTAIALPYPRSGDCFMAGCWEAGIAGFPTVVRQSGCKGPRLSAAGLLPPAWR